MPEQAPARSSLLFSRDALLRLIIPLVIEQLLLMTVGMADTVMVTTSGEAAVSGVSLVDNINTLIIQVFSALSTGGAVVVSQYLGRQDTDNAKAASKQLLYAMCALSLLLMGAALVLRQHILALIFGRVEADVMENALVYFLLTATAYPFMGIYNAGAALFRAMGNSKVSMFCSLVVNVINITVNAVLIFGFGMGAAGAGIGTLVSRIAAAVIIMALLNHPDHVLRVEGLLRFEFRGAIVKRILFIGIPNGMENGMFQAGKLMVLNLITTFGTSAVAANAIANSVAGVINVPGMALGPVSYTHLLFWAFIYNIIGIPLAAGVWYPLFQLQLSPMFGAAAMSLSSVCVVSNALRLKFFRPERRESPAAPVSEGTPKSVETKGTSAMTKTMSINGMMCAHCQAHVEKALNAIDGVEAKVNLETKTATLTLSKDVSDDVLRGAVTEAGYEVVSIQ